MSNDPEHDDARTAWLMPVSGPPRPAVELSQRDEPVVIGRSERSHVRLASEQVSRCHARVRLAGGRWFLTDLGSGWGTYLNGCRLAANAEAPLREGDQVHIAPWTFAFHAGGSPQATTDLIDFDTGLSTLVQTVAPEAAGALADQLLTLLLECTAGLHDARDEAALAARLLDAAWRGTGLSNAALLRPADAHGRVTVLASRGAPTGEGGDDVKAIFSRALLDAAKGGEMSVFSPGMAASTSESMVQMELREAICVPLTAGPAVYAYLYLDSRGDSQEPADRRGGRLSSGVCAFCLALGRVASLALSNLKRIELERRHALLEADLAAAAAAQRWILPARQGKHGRLHYIGETRPGHCVGGDFFDVIPLDEATVAVALGDVSGHGVAASVLMSAAAGFLHAALRQHRGAAEAVAELNRFVMPRRKYGAFITLWVGIFDLAAMTLRYVDAGHGYALAHSDDSTTDLGQGGGLPIGIADEAYEEGRTALPPGGRVVIVSDGIIERPAKASADPCEGGRSDLPQFGMKGLRASLLNPADAPDIVAHLFAAVQDEAGAGDSADDATALAVWW